MTPQEQFSDLAKVAPPIAITSMDIMGFPMSDLVLLLTAVYTLLQIFIVVRRLIVSRRASDTTCLADCPGRQKK